VKGASACQMAYETQALCLKAIPKCGKRVTAKTKKSVFGLRIPYLQT
jgi:hypothetical protein